MAFRVDVTDISAPELAAYAGLTRRQLARDGLFIAESGKVILAALEAGFEPVSLLAEGRKLDSLEREILPRCGEIPVYTAPRETLAALTGYELTRSVLCAMRRREEKTMEAVCEKARRIAVLEDIADTTNMGAIFRSAAALGMDGLLLTQGCCDPLSRRSLRVSMGSVFKVPWAHVPAGQWPEKALAYLHGMGFASAAMALGEPCVPVNAPQLREKERLAIVLGTEGDGLAQQTIARCSFSVRIPMSHGVDSLNVAAASAVAFWELGVRGERE